MREKHITLIVINDNHSLPPTKKKIYNEKMKPIILLFLSIFLTACTSMQTAVMPNHKTTTSDSQAILNTVSNAVNTKHHLNVSLNAHYLKIKNNWAYVETTGGGDPSVNAVLKKKNNQWVIVAPSHPCNPVCPSGMTSCADGELICQNTLHQQFPNAPVSIFPSSSARAMVFVP